MYNYLNENGDTHLILLIINNNEEEAINIVKNKIK